MDPRSSFTETKMGQKEASFRAEVPLMKLIGG